MGCSVAMKKTKQNLRAQVWHLVLYLAREFRAYSNCHLHDLRVHWRCFGRGNFLTKADFWDTTLCYNYWHQPSVGIRMMPWKFYIYGYQEHASKCTSPASGNVDTKEIELLRWICHWGIGDLGNFSFYCLLFRHQEMRASTLHVWYLLSPAGHQGGFKWHR